MEPSPDLRRKNRRTLLLLSGLTVTMFGFGFALVPLYGLLCQVTGSPSVGQRSAQGPVPQSGAPVQERWVTVKFDGTVHPDLPWSFAPLEQKLLVHPGESYEIRFLAENRSSQPVTGQAIPSVAPWEATAYFNKLECFCFQRQTLAGGERLEMPVRFVVSPDLPEDYPSLTLSYSFLRSTADQVAGN